MQQLATLRIYLDSGVKDASSYTHRTADDEWEIVLIPNGTRQPNHEEQENPLDTLAHEIGHFIAERFQLPEHTAQQLAKMLGIEWPLSPREIEAWDIATKINSKLVASPVRSAALKGYKEGDKLRGAEA